MFNWFLCLLPPSDAAKAVANLLVLDPDGWDSDAFVAYHEKTKTGIWIGSNQFAIRFWTGGRNDYSRPWASTVDKAHVWEAFKTRRKFKENTKSRKMANVINEYLDKKVK